MSCARNAFADDITVPTLAKMEAVVGRIWTYVRDDRPFAGTDQPALLFYYSRNRAGEQQRALLSSSNDTAKAINYLLNRWAAFTRFLDDGRVCLTNNAAGRASRGVTVGRNNWTFRRFRCRRPSCRRRLYTCRDLQMNDVDPQTWLAGPAP